MKPECIKPGCDKPTIDEFTTCYEHTDKQALSLMIQHLRAEMDEVKAERDALREVAERYLSMFKHCDCRDCRRALEVLAACEAAKEEP